MSYKTKYSIFTSSDAARNFEGLQGPDKEFANFLRWCKKNNKHTKAVVHVHS